MLWTDRLAAKVKCQGHLTQHCLKGLINVYHKTFKFDATYSFHDTE